MNTKNVVKKVEKSAYLKLTYRLSGNDYRVTTISNSYLTVLGIIIQSLKSFEQI